MDKVYFSYIFFYFLAFLYSFALYFIICFICLPSSRYFLGIANVGTPNTQTCYIIICTSGIDVYKNVVRCITSNFLKAPCLYF